MRIVLELISVMALLGLFGLVDSSIIKVISVLGIIVIAWTSELTKTPGEQAEKGSSLHNVRYRK